MRTQFILTLAALAAFSTPAMAGTVTIMDGKATWQSSQCKQPAEPSSLMRAHRETPADKMNVLMTQYNAYAAQMQTYMDCISNEAQIDSAATSQAIASSAQASIDDAQKKVNEVGEGLNAKK